jgi:hypothetical protein
MQRGAACQKLLIPFGKGFDPLTGGIRAEGFQQARPAQML